MELAITMKIRITTKYVRACGQIGLRGHHASQRDEVLAMFAPAAGHLLPMPLCVLRGPNVQCAGGI
jgi:hypothetical protein